METAILVSGAVGGLGMLALAAYADAKDAERVGAGRVMTYSLPARVVSGAFGIGFACLYLLLLLRAENRTPEALKNGTIGFAIVVLPALFFFSRTLRTRVTLRDGGLSSASTTIRWSEVTSVKNRWLWGLFEISGANGAKIRVSHLLVGQREFARQVLTNVAPENIDCLPYLEKRSAPRQ